jgi:hypothetical protein
MEERQDLFFVNTKHISDTHECIRGQLGLVGVEQLQTRYRVCWQFDGVLAEECLCSSPKVTSVEQRGGRGSCRVGAIPRAADVLRLRRHR